MINYHNHTSLCGHARGELFEYIDRAIELGIGEFCFTDHAPMPESIRQGESMAPEEAEIYISSVLTEREKYKGRIDIKVGFEVDFPLFDSFDRRYFADSRIDCLIGSCHFIDGWPCDHPDFLGEFDKWNIDELYVRYFDIIGDLVESGLFDIAGHIDLIKKFGHRPKGDISNHLLRLVKRIRKSGIVVEINTAGLFKPVGEIYPSAEIVQLLFDNNIPLTLGSDSHSPEAVGLGYERAIAMLKRIGYRKLSGFSKRRRYDVSLG